MFREVRKRVQKVGQPPGTAVFTGKEHPGVPVISAVFFTEQDYHEKTGTSLQECLPSKKEPGITWVNIDGLHDVTLIKQIAKRYHLHPLTVEDILNVEQRPKVEEFDGYLFVTLKMLFWHEGKRLFTAEQLSLVLGKDFVLSFQERGTNFFENIHDRLRSSPKQRLRQHGSDYLFYRIIDTVVDRYFTVLEGLGEHIEEVEEHIILNPNVENNRTIYRLKRQGLQLRKVVWPIREVINHLLQVSSDLISPFTHIYIRDVYDHTVQAMDTLEIFRDMLSGMLDVYLSSLSHRMNEVMKVLTIIATIFIPLTFISSLYGMNFFNMPEIHWRYGYPVTVVIMIVVAIGMLSYFRKKKWL